MGGPSAAREISNTTPHALSAAISGHGWVLPGFGAYRLSVSMTQHVCGLGFRVYCLGVRIKGLGFRV
jgi:hypothetical protein